MHIEQNIDLVTAIIFNFQKQMFYTSFSIQYTIESFYIQHTTIKIQIQTNPQYIELHIYMLYFIILSSVELYTRMRSNPLTLPSIETGLSSASVILKSYIASTR